VPGASGTSPVEQLRADAHIETKAITNAIHIRGIYGWAPGPDFRLAVQTAGEWPKISADELPPRYEQYVQIEVTIDKDGTVADARILSGIVDEKIQQKLLAAVREFKYVPATRNGSPIPSQRDIIVHVPS
jgi:TonB family protein